MTCEVRYFKFRGFVRSQLFDSLIRWFITFSRRCGRIHWDWWRRRSRRLSAIVQVSDETVWRRPDQSNRWWSHANNPSSHKDVQLHSSKRWMVMQASSSEWLFLHWRKWGGSTSSLLSCRSSIWLFDSHSMHSRKWVIHQNYSSIKIYHAHFDPPRDFSELLFLFYRVRIWRCSTGSCFRLSGKHWSTGARPLDSFYPPSNERPRRKYLDLLVH